MKESHAAAARATGRDRRPPLARRDLLTLSALGLPAMLLGSCTRQQPAFSGYALVANQGGNAIAVVDLGIFSLLRHIPLNGAPNQILAARQRPAAYALTPENGTVHEIDTGTLGLARSLKVSTRGVQMAFAPDESLLYLLSATPRALFAINLESFEIAWRVRIPEAPLQFDISRYGAKAALATNRSVRLLNLDTQQLGDPLTPAELSGEFGSIRFLDSGGALIVADLTERRLSVIDTEDPDIAAARLITHLPLAVRPDRLCFSTDGGQLFVTGEGLDAVVIVYPYNTPEVAGTILAGRTPGAMAASDSLLFVASPEGSDISIIDIVTAKVIAVAPVGAHPSAIQITPNQEYALVLNQQSGDMAVLRVDAISPNRYRSAAPLTMIPVGSQPVSVAVALV